MQLTKWVHGPIYEYQRSVSLTLVQDHSDSTFSNCFTIVTAGPIEAKFFVESPWDKGTKVCSNNSGHMTKVAAMPIYGKNLKNLLLLIQKAHDLETWYATSGTQVLQNLFTWRPCVDPDLLLWQGQIWALLLLCVCVGGELQQWIFRNLL